MKKNLIIVTGINILFAGALVFIYSLIPATAYVDTNKLFNEFQLKKELELTLSNVKNQRKQILDSLELQLNVLSGQLNGKKALSAGDKETFASLREEYFYKKKQFDEDNEALTQKYNQQIFQQLNQYIQDYSKEEGYDYVFGAEGSGALMAASEKKNITEEVLSFINLKYQGADNGK